MTEQEQIKRGKASMGPRLFSRGNKWFDGDSEGGYTL